MKKLILAALAAGAALAGAAPSLAETTPPQAQSGATVDAAVAFAKDLTADATAALTSSKPDAEQLADFQKVLAEGLALDVIGKFMIGDARKSMTAAQKARYDAAFPPYLTKLYADQFAEIVGRPLEVKDAKAIGTRDVVVRTQFTRKDGPPINVDWRIRKLRSGELKAIDIIVAGVSIMLVKREEFSAYIAQNGVDALLSRLEAEAKQTTIPDDLKDPKDQIYANYMKLLALYAEQFQSIGGAEKHPTQKHVEMVKQAVRDELIDPSSAEFYEVKEAQGAEGKFVCGEVNSKNRFGGYVGKRMFIGIGSNAIIESHEKNAADAALVSLYLQRCIRNGG